MFKKFLLYFVMALSLTGFASCESDEPEGPNTNTEDPTSQPVDGGVIDAKLPSGIYLGIYGFNQAVYDCPISRLDKSTLESFNRFITGLTMKNGTLLYYSVEQALNAMMSSPLPADLSTVALVTFTDGLDQGSMMKNDKYSSESTYLDALRSRISSTTISGNKISAYSIGVRGSDVSDTYMFRQNLEKLASDSDNAFEVTSMSEVNSKFQEIAKHLSQSNYIQTINLKMPGVANGTRVRFTFDNVYFASNSDKYIEGTFNLSNKTLENVKYVGLTSTSGSTVKGNVEDIFVSFTFEGVHADDDELIESQYTDEWTYISSNSSWQINSEFDKSENSEIRTQRSSAAIMLVLDCSSSLDSQFSTAQSNAKNFINILYKAALSSLDSDDPNPTINGHEYVDLGLPSGIKWATCNVGASTSTEHGDYFAWGETKPKSTYTENNSVTDGVENFVDISGDPTYDAARANWGGSWRMPTQLEMQELVDNCEWTWTTKGEIKGYEVTGPNGQFIFFPYVGYRTGSSLWSAYGAGSGGFYWSSTPYDEDYQEDAYYLSFGDGGYSVGRYFRYIGLCVRPVTD